MAVLKPSEAAIRFKQFRQLLPGAIMAGLEDGNRAALKISVTKYFEGSPQPPGRSLAINPPNPPPGPLKIRSGDLRRGIEMIQPSQSGSNFIAGLETDVFYGKFHELGLGRFPERPFLAPAIEDARELYIQGVNVQVTDLAARLRLTP